MFSGQVRRSARRFVRWSSAVAEPVSSASKKSGMNSTLLTALGVGGTIAGCYSMVLIGGHSTEEVALRAKAVERESSDVKRADPVALSKEIADYLRFTEPEASPQLVQLGVALCVAGYSEELAKHEKFHIMQKFKDANKVMSWADLGAYVAYHALLEMGAPLVCMSPYFGRSESQAQSVAKQYKSLPGNDATYADIVQWGKQFELTEAETVAVIGGQTHGSVLFSPNGRDMEVSHRYYKNVLNDNDVPYAKALKNSTYGKQCCVVFAGDQLYWNRYFVDGLNKVLLHKWTNLKELPTRMLGTTSDAAWATRQQMVYGVQHSYTGASAR